MINRTVEVPLQLPYELIHSRGADLKLNVVCPTALCLLMHFFQCLPCFKKILNLTDLPKNPTLIYNSFQRIVN